MGVWLAPPYATEGDQHARTPLITSGRWEPSALHGSNAGWGYCEDGSVVQRGGRSPYREVAAAVVHPKVSPALRRRSSRAARTGAG